MAEAVNDRANYLAACEEASLAGIRAVIATMVEDDPQLRRLTERALRERGYSVLTASNGSEALVRAHEFSGTIGLLLTDVVMPYMSGVQLAAQMVVLRPGIGVLDGSCHPGGAPVHERLGELKSNSSPSPSLLPAPPLRGAKPSTPSRRDRL